MADTIQAALDMSNVDSSQVEITTTSQYVMLSLSSGILFDSGKADLKAEAISVVDKVADAVKIYDDNTIQLKDIPIMFRRIRHSTRIIWCCQCTGHILYIHIL